MKKIICSDKAPAPIGPYSQAVAANDLLYVSGQIGIKQSTGELLQTDIETETSQVMQNIGYILAEAGIQFDAILKCTIFVINMDDYAAINSVYDKYFEADNAPAREVVGVACLPKNANIEISCIARLS